MTLAVLNAAPPRAIRPAADQPPWFTGGVWGVALVGAALMLWRWATLRGGVYVDPDEVIGADFATFWAAARLAVAGKAAAVFDIAGFDAYQRTLLGRAHQFAFWSYPPPTLLLYLPFAGLSYIAAYAGWTVASTAALAPVARRWLGSAGRAAPLLACPAMLMGFLVGQNGPVAAALLLGGLMLVDRRPWLAGAVLGFLAIKPQMALLLPVAVIAGRHWRVMGGAALSVGALVMASLLAFGFEPWRGFLAQTLPTQAHMLRQGEGWFQWAMPTAFMAARLLGAPWQAAMLAQAPFVLLGAVLVWRAWRSAAMPLADRAIVLTLASVSASPQLFNYDLVAYSAALLLWAWRDPRPEPCAWALVGWAMPALCIVLSGLHAPLSPMILAALAWRAGVALTPRPCGAEKGPVVPRPAFATLDPAARLAAGAPEA